MSKQDQKKYRGFREFYEDEDDTNVSRRKPIKESRKNKNRFDKKIKNVDPRNLTDEDFFDDEDFYN